LGFAAGALARAGSNASGASVATVALERGLFGGVVADSDLSAIYRFVAAEIEPEARSAARISIQLASDEPLPANGVQVPDDFESFFELTDEEIGAMNEGTVDRPSETRAELFDVGFPILPFRRSEYRIRFEVPGGVALEATAPVQRSVEEMMRRHREVALEFAPVFIQRSSATNFQDFFVRFNFDGDWNGFHNAENLEGGGPEIDLRPTSTMRCRKRRCTNTFITRTFTPSTQSLSRATKTTSRACRRGSKERCAGRDEPRTGS